MSLYFLCPALISTCVDTTSVSSEGCVPLSLSFYSYFFIFSQLLKRSPFIRHLLVLVLFLPLCFTPSLSLSPVLFASHAVSLPTRRFLINGEPRCLSYQQIALLSINYSDRAGRPQRMGDTHTHTQSNQIHMYTEEQTRMNMDTLVHMHTHTHTR